MTYAVRVLVQQHCWTAYIEEMFVKPNVLYCFKYFDRSISGIVLVDQRLRCLWNQPI